MDEKKLIIPQSLAMAILNYLSTLPYNEVYKLIGGLQSMAPYEEPVQEKKPTDE